MKLISEINPDAPAVSESAKVESPEPVTGDLSGIVVGANVLVGSDGGVPVGPAVEVAIRVGVGVLVGS